MGEMGCSRGTQVHQGTLGIQTIACVSVSVRVSVRVRVRVSVSENSHADADITGQVRLGGSIRAYCNIQLKYVGLFILRGSGVGCC